MQVTEVSPINANNPIPVYGIETKTKKQAASNAKTVKPKSKKMTETGDLNAQIAERAYYKAEAREFSPGYALEDWLAAEAEMNNEGR